MFILLALAPDYLSNSTVLVRSGQEAKQGLFWHGFAHGETPTESLYCIGSDNGKAMPAPPTGSATSGRKQRQHAEKGRTDEPAGKGYMHTKPAELAGSPSMPQAHSRHMEKGHCTRRSYIQGCSGKGCLWSVIYMDIINSMPKTQKPQTTTTKTQNTCLKGKITHNIRFFHMAGPGGLQNPSLLWAGKPTRGALSGLLKGNILDEPLGLRRKTVSYI